VTVIVCPLRSIESFFEMGNTNVSLGRSSVQEKLRKLCSSEGWHQYLRLEEVSNARSVCAIDVLVKWAFAQGLRSGRAGETTDDARHEPQRSGFVRTRGRFVQCFVPRRRCGCPGIGRLD